MVSYRVKHSEGAPCPLYNAVQAHKLSLLSFYLITFSPETVSSHRLEIIPGASEGKCNVGKRYFIVITRLIRWGLRSAITLKTLSQMLEIMVRSIRVNIPSLEVGMCCSVFCTLS